MAQCISPFHSKQTGMSFPCGKCYPCLQRRQSGWSFRLMQEDKIALSSFFVTLTYNTDYVPITKKGFMSLDKKHVQKFIKRLRKHNKTTGIKYFACGEYGGKTMRPHYHLIIFNCSVSALEKSWTLGHIHLGFVSNASVGYTLKYMMKEGKVPIHKNDDRVPEFQLMSKGLGKNYINERTIKWHQDDIINRYYLPLEGGKKACVPRYYKNFISNHKQRALIAEKQFVDKKDLTPQEEHRKLEHYSRKLKNQRLAEKL